MTYAIAKRGYADDNAIYVTAIRKGGLSIDNVRIWDDRLARESWQVRKFSSHESAARQLSKLATVGGLDDYEIVNLAE